MFLWVILGASTYDSNISVEIGPFKLNIFKIARNPIFVRRIRKKCSRDDPLTPHIPIWSVFYTESLVFSGKRPVTVIDRLTSFHFVSLRSGSFHFVPDRSGPFQPSITVTVTFHHRDRDLPSP
jgi:hypothetical protein